MTNNEIEDLVSALEANDMTMKMNGISENLWGDAIECIKFLQAENEKLRTKLNKSIELKYKLGDTVYLIQRTKEHPEGEILETMLTDYEIRNNLFVYHLSYNDIFYAVGEPYIYTLTSDSKEEAEEKLDLIKKIEGV